MVLVLVLVAPSLAATLTVGPFGADYDTVVEAVDAAASGDRIEVHAGTYAGTIDFDGKELELVGLDGAEATWLIGDSGQPALVLDDGEGADSLVEDLTLAGSNAPAAVLEDSTATLRAVVVEDNDDSAIVVVGGSPVLDGLTLTSNVAEAGADLHVSGDATVSLTDSVLSDSTGYDYGVIFIDEGARVDVSGSTFSSPGWSGYEGGLAWVDGGGVLTLTDVDTTGSSCGGIYLYGSTLEVEGGTWLACGHVRGLVGPVVTIRDLEVTAPDLSLDGLFDINSGTFVAEDVTYTAEDGLPFAELWAGTADLSGVTLTGPGDDSYARALVGGYGVELTISDSVIASWRNIGGAGVDLDEGDLLIVDTAFESVGTRVGGWDSEGGAIAANDATVVLERVSFTDCVADQGSAVYLDGTSSTLSCDGCVVDSPVSSTVYLAYAFYGDDVEEMSFVDSSIEGEEAGVYAEAAALTLEGCTVSGLDQGVAGDVGDLYVTGTSFSAIAADETMAAALAVTADEALIEGNSFLDNSNTDGPGAMFVYSSGETVIDGNHFEGNSSEGSAGALYMYEAEVLRNSFCGNSSGAEGGAIHAYAFASTLSNNVFQDNSAATGGALFVGAGGTSFTFTVDFGTFVGNSADSGGHIAVSGDAALQVASSLFAYGGAGDGIVMTGSGAAASAFGYNDFWENADSNVGGKLGADVLDRYDNIFEDPDLSGYTGTCGDDLRPGADSALVDAGEDGLYDRDGSRADIGAWGGETPVAWDGDEDGADYREDCDDDDATIYPGADEIPDDGIDQDCDGADATSGGTGDGGGGSDSGSSDGGSDEGGGDSGSSDGGTDGGSDDGGGDSGGSDGGTDSGGSTDGGSTDGGNSDDSGGGDEGTTDGSAGGDGEDIEETEDSKGCSTGGLPFGSWVLLPVLLGLQRRQR